MDNRRVTIGERVPTSCVIAFDISPTDLDLGHGELPDKEALLSKMVEIITQSVRSGDSIFRARDRTLLVILPRTPGNGAATVSSRTIELLDSNRYTALPVNDTLAFRAGVAVQKDDCTESFEDMISRATMALYHAKKTQQSYIINV